MNRASGGMTGQLEALRARVGRWRAGCGGKRCRIPEELWNAAIDVARSEGLYATSKATRLNYGALKLRSERVVSVGGSETSAPTFIEVAMPRVTTSEAASKTVVELEGRGGGRLRVEVTGMSAVDVVGLAHAFWSRER